MEQKWIAGAASRFRPDGQVGTPFYPRVAELCARNWYFNWDVRHVVDEFEDFAIELAAIRSGVAIADMSPLSKTEITGPDAGELVQRLVVRDIRGLKPGQIYFTPWCTEEGKVVTDGLVFRIGEQTYRFTSDPTLEWFRQQAGGMDVEIQDVTDNFGIMTVQGPLSRQLLETVTGKDWAKLDFSRVERTKVNGRDVEVARTGFTGELGYEITVATDAALDVWDAFYDAGKGLGGVPAGEYALDIARVEAGLLITGCDYANAGPDPSGSHTRASADARYLASPYELNMGHFVDLSKDAFIGKAALQAERDGTPRRRLAGLEIDWRNLAEAHVTAGLAPTLSPRVSWQPMAAFSDGNEAGWASSATWSPTLRKLVAFGHLDHVVSKPGTTVSIRWKAHGGGVMAVPARVVPLPFMELKRSA